MKPEEAEAMCFGDLLGWVAAALVFSTFLARQMTPLRALAIFSNIAFIAYGSLYHLWPIVGLHVAMLPVNIVRLRQALAAARTIIPEPQTTSPAVASRQALSA